MKSFQQDQGNPTRVRQMPQQQQQTALSDELATVTANLAATSTTLDGIAAGVLALDTMIQNFQNSPGSLSAPDQASLDAIATASTALAAKAAAISTAPPSPTPPPTPAATRK